MQSVCVLCTQIVLLFYIAVCRYAIAQHASYHFKSRVKWLLRNCFTSANFAMSEQHVPANYLGSVVFDLFQLT